MGFSYTYVAGTAKGEEAAESFTVAVSLEPGAQVEVSAGLVANLANMPVAFDGFDAEFERVMALLGRPAYLVGRGYDTITARPEGVELVPKGRYQIMDSCLSRQGKYTRDMMRCSTATQASIDFTDEPETMTLEKVATVLGRYCASRLTTRSCGAASRLRAWCAAAPGTSSTRAAAASSPAALTTISRSSATAAGWAPSSPFS